MRHAAPVVVCDSVSRVYGTGPSAVVAVHGTSCTVDEGARIAIVGPSGSGKSTLLHLLAGLEPATVGAVSWPGLSAGASRAFQIGVMFQGLSLVPALSVVENVALPLVLQGASYADTRAIDTLRVLGVDDLADKLPEELSGGQAQRVAAARVLAQQPRLILADEPTGQLDRANGQKLIDVLLATASQLGAALVVSTHDLDIAHRLETSWFMNEGRLRTQDLESVRP